MDNDYDILGWYMLFQLYLFKFQRNCSIDYYP
jgi:hypothetical protein